MTKYQLGMAAIFLVTACSGPSTIQIAHAQTLNAQYYPGPYSGYHSSPAPNYYYRAGIGDPAFGYEPRGSTPHPHGPEPGGGFYHMGSSNVGRTD